MIIAEVGWCMELIHLDKELKKYEMLREDAIAKIIKQKAKEEEIAFTAQLAVPDKEPVMFGEVKLPVMLTLPVN